MGPILEREAPFPWTRESANSSLALWAEVGET
ncbi:hypothetical protein T4B_554 [Trichinella pseudospiralis]|uniref:Uncharacterized protein n=1 Tax=Trichinella pseudospiralis TaxID=6337 RepID=A0A0V1F315_TRIPS|nr:hypothetical protein T4B_554 [Trichinella pseudospiralis]